MTDMDTLIERLLTRAKTRNGTLVGGGDGDTYTVGYYLQADGVLDRAAATALQQALAERDEARLQGAIQNFGLKMANEDCDKLEAEIDECERQFQAKAEKVLEQMIRAETAEAEITRLTAALSEERTPPRLCLDTEFNGFGGELISMALVADDGREWYAVLPEPMIWDAWCADHVLPVISAVKPTIYCNGREEFRQSLHNFLLQFDNPIIVADWYVDLVHFFHSFEGKDHTKSIAYACRAELMLVDEIEPEFPHNALSDARAITAAIRSRKDKA